VSTGLIALLDDIAALAKVAAATLDDVAAQATKAGAKAAGVVIDDAAVTPRYVVGFAASRELPIVRRIAVGSLRNKLLILLPAALMLSLLLPSAITPLLMLGGAFLCFEGAEKLFEKLWPHHEEGAPAGVAPEDAQAFEDARVRGAIQTDFILSAEIMAIALATLPDAGFWMQAVTLTVVAIGVTVLVYGAVALIVKADDAGLAMARQPWSVVRVLGRGLVKGMPHFLTLLSAVGTAAMLWVGGGILLHGMEVLGPAALPQAVHELALAAGHALPGIAGLIEWLVQALASAVLGLLVGALLIPMVQHLIVPLARRFRPAASQA